MAEVEITVDSYSKGNAGIKSAEGKWWDFAGQDDESRKDEMVQKLSNQKIRRGNKLILKCQDPTKFKYEDFDKKDQGEQPAPAGNGNGKGWDALDLKSEKLAARLDDVLEFNAGQMGKCIAMAKVIVEGTDGIAVGDTLPIALALFEKQGIQNFTAIRSLV